MDKIRKFLEKNFGREGGRRRLLFALAVVAGVLLIMLSFIGGEEEKNTALGDYKACLEDELSEVCSSVDGAGKCRVTVSFAEGERLEYRGSNIISSTPPRVSGVIIICEGADRVEVRRSLTDAMTALFDVGSNKVSVLKMK